MDQNNQDQADLLRKQMDEINQHHVEEESASFFDPSIEEIDILNLPPRKTVHDERKTKTKLKINVGFIRFFAILIFIIAILIFTYSYWGSYFLNHNYDYTSLLTYQISDAVQNFLVT